MIPSAVEAGRSPGCDCNRKGGPVTREEFIGRAADAMLRRRGLDPERPLPGFLRVNAVEAATVALDAVGAWTAWCRLEEIRDEHGASASGKYCRTCDDLEGPNFPCETRRMAESHVGSR